MQRIIHWKNQINVETRNWGVVCAILTLLVLTLAPPPLTQAAPAIPCGPEKPCQTGTCCNGTCCAGTCCNGTCCPTGRTCCAGVCCTNGQNCCNSLCCTGNCLKPTTGPSICCPQGQIICDGKCCAQPVCCNKTHCGNQCNLNVDGTGGLTACAECPDAKGDKTLCYTCDTDGDGEYDACVPPGGGCCIGQRLVDGKMVPVGKVYTDKQCCCPGGSVIDKPVGGKCP